MNLTIYIRPVTGGGCDVPPPARPKWSALLSTEYLIITVSPQDYHHQQLNTRFNHSPHGLNTRLLVMFASMHPRKMELGSVLSCYVALQHRLIFSPALILWTLLLLYMDSDSTLSVFDDFEVLFADLPSSLLLSIWCYIYKHAIFSLHANLILLQLRLVCFVCFLFWCGLLHVNAFFKRSVDKRLIVSCYLWRVYVVYFQSTI